MKTRILLVLFLAIGIISCKKDKDSVTADQQSLLTAKSWKPVLRDNNTSINPTGGTNSYYPALSCELDDSYTFKTGNQLTLNKGETQCTAGETASETSIYSIDLSAKKITIKGVTYTLAELSDTQLKYYASVPSASGFNNIIYIYGH